MSKSLKKKHRNTPQESVRPILNHTCQLPLASEAATKNISDGLFVKFRRKLWRWVTVDAFNLQSKQFLKSAAKIDEEKIRHMEKYPNKIHPFSQFRYAWECFMIVVLTLFYLYIPMAQTDNLPHLYGRLAIQMACKLDIIMCCFTGYFDKDKQVVVLDGKKIILKYLKTFFIFDFISAFPFSLYLLLFNKLSFDFLNLGRLFRLARIPTLRTYINRVCEKHKINLSYVNFFCFTVLICIIILWATSIVHVVNLRFRPEPYEMYEKIGRPKLMTFYGVIRTVLLIGITRWKQMYVFEIVIAITCIVCGAVLKIYVLSTTLHFFQKRSSSNKKYNYLQEEINIYMKYKELPLILRKRIQRFVEFKFQKHIFREDELLMNVSPFLRGDILLHICQTMVEQVDFFKDLPPQILLRIVTKLKNEIFLPSDVIVYAGEAGHCMYFIAMGVVAVYATNAKEICHLGDGDHFGEIALVINAPRVATVVAVRECELFKLSRRDFQEAIGPFPELFKKIRESAMSRLESTIQLAGQPLDELQTLTSSMSVHSF